jgi:myo-inositol 2-dehydrogenase/D-chiro-inositol 1-dehydrogenase
MRIGLIGLGRIGAFHAETLAALDTVDSLVVTDALPEVTARVAAKVGAEPVDSPEKLLASGVDGVLVAAPTGLHAELTLAAVAAGIPTFCEKPLAATPAEAERVAAAVSAAGVPVHVGFPRRFDPAFLGARAAVVNGELGRLRTVRSTTLDPAPPPAAYIAGSGGIFHDCAVHDFDAVRWVTGREVVEVYATGSNGGAAFFAEAGDVDTAATVLTFDDGTLGLVSNTRYNGRGYDVRLEVHGVDDSVAAGLDDGLPLRNTHPGATFPAGPPHTFFIDRLATAFRAELAAFVEVVAGRAPVPCTVDDAVAVAWIAEAATRSLRSGRPVRIAEIREAAAVC